MTICCFSVSMDNSQKPTRVSMDNNSQKLISVNMDDSQKPRDYKLRKMHLKWQ